MNLNKPTYRVLIGIEKIKLRIKYLKWFKVYNKSVCEGKICRCFQKYRYFDFHFSQIYTFFNIPWVAAARFDKFFDAIQNYQKAIEYNPEYADAYNKLGNDLRNCGRLCEAGLSYGKEIRINPSQVEYHNNIGVTFLKMRLNSL